jgi:hypothetical protein
MLIRSVVAEIAGEESIMCNEFEVIFQFRV